MWENTPLGIDHRRREVLTQLDRVRIRAHRAGRAQYLAAKQAGAMHSRLGLPSVVLSATVGTAVFGTLAVQPEPYLVILTGGVSLGAGILTAVQTFFSFAERAEKHRMAGAKYIGIKRHLDLLKTRYATQESIDDPEFSQLSEIIENVNQLDKESPDVPDRLYDRARREQDADIEGI